MRARIPIWSIVTALIPAIRKLATQIEKFRHADSDGGRKLTAEEWEIIVLELLVGEMGPKIVEILHKANR